MNDKQIDRLKGYKAKAVRTQIQLTVGIIVFVWAIYLLKLFVGFDLMATLKGREPASPSIYLIGAMVFSVLTLAWQLPRIQKARALASRGVWTPGTVTAVSALRRNKMVPVTIQYTADGVEYKTRQDMPQGHAVGDTLTVLFDPSNPRRCEAIA